MSVAAPLSPSIFSAILPSVSPTRTTYVCPVMSGVAVEPDPLLSSGNPIAHHSRASGATELPAEWRRAPGPPRRFLARDLEDGQRATEGCEGKWSGVKRP